MGSVVVARGFQSSSSEVAVHGLNCPVVCGNLPRPGHEPVFPVLLSRFLTTVHQRSPEKLFFELLSLPLNLDSNFSDTGEDEKHKIKMTVR